MEPLPDIVMSSADAEPLLKAADEDRKVKRYLLLSHLVTRMGYHAWYFAVQLSVMRYTPGTLLGPALYVLCYCSAGLLVSPRLGSWADIADRLHVVKVGIGLQAVAVVGNSVLVFSTSGLRDSHLLLSALFLACFFGMLEKVSFPLTDIIVKRDWVPVLLQHDEEPLQRMNQLMMLIDLGSEVVSPLLAGLLIQMPHLCGGCLHSLGPDKMVVGFFILLIGLVNAATSIAQYVFLRKLHTLRRRQLARTGAEKAAAPPNGGILAMCNASAWRGWAKHPFGVPLLSMAYALLYLTVLAPQGALFTAYMANAGVPAMTLSLFRGCGAAGGFCGASARPLCLKVLPERLANVASVGALAACVLCAAVVFKLTVVLQPQDPLLYLYIFGGFVVMGRPGLYAFQLGVLNQEQWLVDETQRAAVGAVDEALQSGFTFAMYCISTVFNKTEQFAGLVYLSATCVTAGCLTYIAWTLLYHEHRHRHTHRGKGEAAHGQLAGEEHGHGHLHDGHPHTIQVERCIDEDGCHTHLHFNPFWTRGRKRPELELVRRQLGPMKAMAFDDDGLMQQKHSLPDPQHYHT